VLGGNRPSQQAADVVADDHRVLLAESGHQLGDVSCHGGGVIAPGRLVRGAVATQIHRDGPVTSVGQVDQLA
jgi:hypothetical protein